MSVVDEIREQQRQALSAMSFREKLAYFWDYYKLHTVVAVCVVALIAAIVSQYQSNRPYAFYAVLLNADANGENHDTSVIWAGEFQEFAEIDPDAYQVYIDPSITISADNTQYGMAGRQKMAAMMQVGDIHAILADTETFEGYARLEYFYDLSSVFTEEELAPYADFLYYTDAAAFDEDTGDTLEDMEAAQEAVYSQVIDHRDPSAMEKPVAVGVCIPKTGNKLADSGYYAYLDENGYTFQGYPSETVIGIPLSVENPKLMLQFLEYLEVGGS